jgi:predicted RNase H-like HicB family nuclease
LTVKSLNLGKIRKMRDYKFTAEITRDNEVNQYIGIIPVLPGAHTQAPTLDELYQNLQDVVQLCLQEMTEEEIKDLPDFVGFQQISVAI